jgi:hypothetical protein
VQLQVSIIFKYCLPFAPDFLTQNTDGKTVANFLLCMCTDKIKVKLFLCLTKHNATKTYWRNGGIALCILNLGTTWRWVVSFMPRPLYPQGKSPWYPLDRRLGGSQSRSGGVDEEKECHHDPCQKSNPGRPACSLVSTLSELLGCYEFSDFITRRLTSVSWVMVLEAYVATISENFG